MKVNTRKMVQKMKLSCGDIVWSGQPNAIEYLPCHIVYLAREPLGCACPKEAIPYLRSLGIEVNTTSKFKSGYRAVGCYIYYQEKKLSPHIDEFYKKVVSNSNKLYSYMLERIEDQ